MVERKRRRVTAFGFFFRKKIGHRGKETQHVGISRIKACGDDPLLSEGTCDDQYFHCDEPEMAEVEDELFFVFHGDSFAIGMTGAGWFLLTKESVNGVEKEHQKCSTVESKLCRFFTPVYIIISRSSSFILVIFKITPSFPSERRGFKMPLPTETASAPSARAL